MFGLTNLSDFVLISEIQAKFEKYSENWKTFSQDDEDMLDSELKEFVSKHSLSFYEKSLEKDEKKQGIIEWKDFVDILSSFKIHFSEKLLNYCKLLLFKKSYEIFKCSILHERGYCLFFRNVFDSKKIII